MLLFISEHTILFEKHRDGLEKQTQGISKETVAKETNPQEKLTGRGK